MHDDVGHTDIFTLGTSSGPSTRAEDHARRALEAAKAHELTAHPPQRRRFRLRSHKRATFVTVAVLALGGSGAYAASHSSSTSAVLTREPFPARVQALACIQRFNGPSGARLRALITGIAPPSSPFFEPGSRIQSEVRRAGTPITAAFQLSAPASGCVDPGVTIVFRHHQRLTAIAFPDVSHPYLNSTPRPIVVDAALHNGDTSGDATTSVEAGGLLSMDVHPPASVKHWGGAFGSSVHVIAAATPITNQVKTCVEYAVRMDHPGQVSSYGNRIESPLIRTGDRLPPPVSSGSAYPVTPGAPLQGRTCFFWNGHAANPPAEPRFWRHPHTHLLGAGRSIVLQIQDAGIASSPRAVTLEFKVEPVNPVGAQHATWQLVYEGATTARASPPGRSLSE